MILQKKPDEKFCNCRNSKCMKLYCQCFAARLECNKNCRCTDCHNNTKDHSKYYKDYLPLDRKNFKQDSLRQHKGCACRKSGCTKKYCQCYQAGLLCRDICKCVDCQNNQSLSNKKVLSQLKRSSSSVSNKGTSLYPIILTQNNQHLQNILVEENPLHLKDQWIEGIAKQLYQKGKGGSIPEVIEHLLSVLNVLDNQASSDIIKKQQKPAQTHKIQQQYSEQMNDSIKQQRSLQNEMQEEYEEQQSLSEKK